MFVDHLSSAGFWVVLG